MVIKYDGDNDCENEKCDENKGDGDDDHNYDNYVDVGYYIDGKITEESHIIASKNAQG